MFNKKYKIFLFLSAVFFGLFFCWLSIFAQSSDINIIMNVEESGGTGGGGDTTPTPTPTDNSPSIDSTNITPSYTSALIVWTASDDNGLSGSTLVYGPSASYGLSATVSGSYQATLSGLASGTLYYYKISVTDTVGQITASQGTFGTLIDAYQDITSPVISNLSAVAGINTASITWLTNEPAFSELYYQTGTNQQGQVNSNLLTTHSYSLTGLLPKSLYTYWVISTDASGNSVSSTPAIFTTLADTIVPANVSGLTLSTTTQSIKIDWLNPSATDFAGVKVLRKTGSASANKDDGFLIYTGVGQSATDSNFSYNTTYYYSVFSFDSSGNYSSGVSQSINYVSAILPILVENCSNNIDDDKDGLTDCADQDCKNYSACVIAVENCSNGADDDNDGFTDCNDNECFGLSTCQTTIQPPDQQNQNQSQVQTPASSGVSEIEKLSLSDFQFLAGDQSINLTPDNGVVSGLSGQPLTIRILAGKLKQNSALAVLKIGKNNYQFTSSSLGYQTTISFPNLQTTAGYIQIDYGNGKIDNISLSLRGLAFGDIYGADNVRLEGVKVELYQSDGQKFSAQQYGQINPMITNVNGIFGWTVPNGLYYLTAEKDGYYKRKTPVFEVKNNIINSEIDLILIPAKIKDVIDPNASLSENIKNVAGNLSDKAGVAAKQTLQGAVDTAKVIQQKADDPAVKKATEQVVAPTTAGVVAISVVPFLSWTNILPLLRLLFLQPLMVLGWNRKRKYGLVYNSLNKQPIDLAIVRLLDADSGRLIQSKVTDKEGRYYFIASPGKYRIEIKKNSFVFPSILLKDFNNDGRHPNIYHGEYVEVNENNAAIIANIPVDPQGENKRPRRLARDRFWRGLQVAVSLAGIIITAASLYISPKWYIVALLVLHILLFFVFRRLAVPAKSKSWGIVYRQDTRAPLSRTIARLFNARFNKLVATQITDRKGRYQFLAGDDEYYVTYDKEGYDPRKLEINLKGKTEDVVNVDVSLRKKLAGGELSVSQPVSQPATVLTPPAENTQTPVENMEISKPEVEELKSIVEHRPEKPLTETKITPPSGNEEK